MDDKIKGLNILHHTHWDREWYETFEEFRYKLRNGIRYIEDLLEKGIIKCFFLDGQTMVIDDYKEIVSKEEFNKLKEFIKNGKIEIGPWYVLADEFLVGGEALIKNLELGIDIAKKLGSEYKIGYLPDTFGHISQMPQVLKGFGINNAIIWRGAVSKDFENNWIASDGSSVLTFVLPLFDGYFQTYMKQDDWEYRLEEYIKANKPYCRASEVLSMNGADHTYTSSNIGERIREFKKKNPDVNVDEVLMSDYIKKFENFLAKSNIIGEQRNKNKIFTLPGVFSSRMYLKQANQRCEDSAINVLEFLNAWSNGITKSDEFIKYIWKLLVQNHAHDSICGCSIDEVHEEMEVRFKKILSAIEQFKKSTLEELYPWDYINNEFVNNKLYLINNVPIKDNYIVESEIIVPKEADKGSISLKYNGKNIDFEILSRKEEEILFRDIKIEPYYSIVYKYKVRFVMEFDGIESKIVNIDLINGNEMKNILITENNEIENDYYKVQINDYGVKILDKKNNKWYYNQNIILSSLDAGDSYNYSPPKGDIISEAKVKEVGECRISNISEEITFTYDLDLPLELSEDRSSGSDELTKVEISTKVKLIKGVNKILFETKINNTAKNHKLRIGFNLGKCNKHYSDTAFDLVERGVLRNQSFEVKEREELECNQHPTLSTIYANDFQLIHEGMQEYEVTEYKNEDYCFITAIRAVGDLSRRDLRTRGGGAGPGYKTPGAQCLREHVYSYGLVIGEEKFNINNKNVIRSKVITKQSNIDTYTNKLIEIEGDLKDISYSSIIRKSSGDISLRIYNTSEDIRKVNINIYNNYFKAYLVNLDGSKEKELSIDNNKISINIDGKKISTILLKL